MTISGAFSSALSGLTAATKASELVSANIANATTPGYGRRELLLTARTGGQGVRIVGVDRGIDQPLVSDRRLAQSEQGAADARAAFYKRIAALMGTPDQVSSLNGRVVAFDSALTEAISHPESEPRLTSAVNAAKGVISALGAIGRDIQAARTAADTDIATQVQQLNDALDRTHKLNVQISKSRGLGQDITALQDQRQQVIDQIAAIVPLREVAESDGTVSLFTTGGGVLLSGRPAVFGFAKTLGVSPPMTLQSGGLSGLTLNGRPTPVSGDSALILGGTLAANFAIRDELAVTAQTQIDALARDLVERFQDSGLDTTRAPGDPGLFTDDGAAFDPLNELGLAQRLKLNGAVDPSRGGTLWRLRDGLGAASSGPVGNTALLSSLRDALNAPREPASGGFMAGQRSFSVFSSDLLSLVSTAKLKAEGDAAYSTTRLETFTSMEAEGGVDTDHEMQSLLQIEHSYAANAKVIKAVDDMMNTLLEI